MRADKKKTAPVKKKIEAKIRRNTVNCLIHVANNLNNDSIIIGHDVAMQLRMRSKQTKLEAGSYTVDVSINMSDKIDDDSVAVNKVLADKLGLYHGQRIRLTALKDALQLGPYVGILATPIRDSTKTRYWFGGYTAFYREVCKAGRDLGLITYVFSYNEADLIGETVIGRYPLEDTSEWTSAPFPFPDVIYNRINTRRGENQESAQAVIQYALANPRISIFNAGYLDKLTTYSILNQSDELKSAMPPTETITQKDTLLNWVNNYGSVYLKPVNGSLGKGIIVVSKTQQGYLIKYHISGNKPVNKQYNSFEKLWSAVYAKIRRYQYLIQPDLHLLKKDNAPFDVRILMQRNLYGNWIRTKMYARVASEGEYTSNISRGGEGLPLDSIINEIAPSKTDGLLNQIRIIALQVASVFEKNYGDTIGELGIDIGIDDQFRLWVIEVNSKPNINVVSKKTQDSIRDASVRRPMEYSIYADKIRLKKAEKI